MKRFMAYGECVQSTLDLGAFLPRVDGHAATTGLIEGESPDHQTLQAVFSLDVHGQRVRGFCSSAPELFTRAQTWRVEIGEVCRFAWREGDPDLVVHREPGVSSARAVFWFLHIVLPFYLSRHRSLLFLHAGAVALNGQAIAFTAPTGTGKSSLVAACLERGLDLVSDDKLAVQITGDSMMALPSHPQCRDYRAVEDLGRHIANYSPHPRPLAGLVVVSRDPGQGSPQVLAVSGAERLQVMLPALLYHFSGDAMSPARQLAQLVHQVPIHRLIMPDDKHTIGEACDQILERLFTGDKRQPQPSRARQTD